MATETELKLLKPFCDFDIQTSVQSCQLIPSRLIGGNACGVGDPEEQAAYQAACSVVRELYNVEAVLFLEFFKLAVDLKAEVQPF